MKNDLRILVLEDVPADAELISSELRNGGISFQAKRVDTRDEFLREIEGGPPDVILSDHGLPSFDGFTALSIAREKCPETPFIFVTGSMGEEVAVNSLRNGATDYVLKSRLSNLAPAVERALHLSKEKKERKQAGPEWTESEQQFRQLVGRMKDHAVFLLDHDGRVSSWNSSMERIFGFQANEIIGRSFGCCYRPEDREVGRPQLDLNAAATGSGFEEEVWRVRKDGSRFWAHVVITTLHDEKGDNCGFVQVTRNITERRQAQEALRKSEESYRLLVDSCPYALFVVSYERIVFANAAAQKLLGAHRPEQLIGRQAINFISVPGQRLFTQCLRSLETTGAEMAVESAPRVSWRERSSSPMEAMFVRLDRKHTPVEMVATRIDFQEEPAIQLMVHALTGQKEQAAAVLGEKEASITTILNVSMDAIICLDHESKIIGWNPSAEKIFGYTREEALSRKLDNLIAPSALHEKHSFSTAGYLMTDPGSLSGCPIGLAARRASGEEFPAVLTIMKNSNGESPVFTCCIHDLAKPPQAEVILHGGERSNKSIDVQTAEDSQPTQEHVIELHMAYETMELFASSLSSEMLAPLSHFESLLEILRNDAERQMDEKSRPYLQAICRSLGQAGRMIGDVLALSPRSRAELHNVRINLVEIIKEMLHDMWSELENRPATLPRFELSNNGDDPSLLRNAIYNLIAHCDPQPSSSS